MDRDLPMPIHKVGFVCEACDIWNPRNPEECRVCGATRRHRAADPRPMPRTPGVSPLWLFVVTIEAQCVQDDTPRGMSRSMS